MLKGISTNYSRLWPTYNCFNFCISIIKDEKRTYFPVSSIFLNISRAVVTNKWLSLFEHAQIF